MIKILILYIHAIIKTDLIYTHIIITINIYDKTSTLWKKEKRSRDLRDWSWGEEERYIRYKDMSIYMIYDIYYIPFVYMFPLILSILWSKRKDVYENEKLFHPSDMILFILIYAILLHICHIYYILLYDTYYY